jgi:hypothetical protein
VLVLVLPLVHLARAQVVELLFDPFFVVGALPLAALPAPESVSPSTSSFVFAFQYLRFPAQAPHSDPSRETGVLASSLVGLFPLPFLAQLLVHPDSSLAKGDRVFVLIALHFPSTSAHSYLPVKVDHASFWVSPPALLLHRAHLPALFSSVVLVVSDVQLLRHRLRTRLVDLATRWGLVWTRLQAYHACALGVLDLEPIKKSAC